LSAPIPAPTGSRLPDSGIPGARPDLPLPRIEEVELREIALRLREPFAISSGSRQERRILLVVLRGEGIEGWGECVAAEDPSYSEETGETAWHMLRDFIVPGILGRSASSPEALLAPAGWVRGNRMARAGLEMAAWELAARARGIPLAEALGSRPRGVAVGVSIGIQPSDEDLVRKAGDYLAEGYRRIKVKIKPGRDLAPLRALRTAFPDALLMADANSAYTLLDLDVLRAMDDLDLLMIEQPLAYDDIREHALLQRELRTPVCLDESIRSIGDAQLAIELGATRVVNLKPGRVGGLGEALRIHDLCVAHGIPVWCGGMLESGVGRAHNVALASLPGFTLPGDISGSRRYWDRDIVDPEFVVQGGELHPAPGAGMGVTPDRARIEALTVRVERFRAVEAHPSGG